MSTYLDGTGTQFGDGLRLKLLRQQYEEMLATAQKAELRAAELEREVERLRDENAALQVAMFELMQAAANRSDPANNRGNLVSGGEKSSPV